MHFFTSCFKNLWFWTSHHVLYIYIWSSEEGSPLIASPFQEPSLEEELLHELLESPSERALGSSPPSTNKWDLEPSLLRDSQVTMMN